MGIDIGFTKDQNWFRYRAAAIIVEDGHVLLAGNDRDDYYYSVGGAVMHGETAEEAVVREVFEETGVHYEVDRLAVIHENFFSDSVGCPEELNCHEVALYFLMKPRGTRELDSHSTTFGGIPEHMHWIPVNELGQHKAYPTFMQEWLEDMSDGVRHIVTRE